jgi:hypothetical protein
MKADLAVYLSQLDRLSEREAKAEAVERAIWRCNHFGLYYPKPYLWGTQG